MSKPIARVQVAIIGVGIAGMSVAAKLALRGVSVLLLEQYGEYPYGATGRSAALFAKSYFSSPQFAMLTTATQSAFETPADGFTDVPLMQDRGALYFAGDEDAKELADLCRELGNAGLDLPTLYRKDVLELVPILRKEKVIFGVFEPDAKDMDVNAIFRAFEKQARRDGAQIICDAEVLEAKQHGSYWTVRTPKGTFEAEILVNAAGAWGDIVAERCGIPKKRLRPLRRTAMIAQAAEGGNLLMPENMPFVFRASNDLYWCKRAEGFLISPSDSTLSAPCDAQPEIEDVARAIQTFEEVTTIKLAPSRPRSWAGLRTFAPDKRPIVGYESEEIPFVWCCGQGGYGIQTSDAMARLTVGLLLDGTVPSDLRRLGLKEEDISPARFRLLA